MAFKSKGSDEFRHGIGANPVVAAARFGVKPRTIAAWGYGEREPSSTQKDAIHAAGGPEPIAWSVPASTPLVRQPSKADESGEAEPASPEATRKLADRLQALARGILDEVDAMGAEDTGAVKRKLDAADKAASVIASLGRLTGAGILNERQILASPAWRHIEDAVVEALEPWPDAMAAVAERLERMRAS